MDTTKNSNFAGFDPSALAQIIQTTQLGAGGNSQANVTATKELPKFQADLTVAQIKKIEDVKHKKVPESIRFGDVISLYVNE